MELKVEREHIVEYGKRLLTSRLTTGFGGNISIYNRDEGLVAIKPSGVDYFLMKPQDVVVVTPEGKIVDGNLTPSSELRFHLALYKYRESINAVVHTHQVYATTIACMNWELPAVHYMVGLSGSKVPLAKYATFGSQELADNITDAIGEHNACLMANHGIVTVGKDIATAYAIAEGLEFVAQIYYQTKSIGNPVILPDEEMKIVLEKFQTYGHPKV